jgi:glycosyltransferase involved in cell wall biosynthesis
MNANTNTRQLHHRPTVSIGIPAYNEGAGIGRVLRDLLGQAEDGFTLREIIVVSDGSTDNTGAEVARAAAGDPRVTFRASRARLGKTARLKQLLRACRGDIILLFDADVCLDDPRFIARAVAAFDPERHGLAGFNTTPLPGRTFVERSLGAGMAVVERVRARWNHGINYLSYRGSCLMLSRSLARRLDLPAELVTNDAYFLFAAFKLGYQPQYAAGARVFYRSPATLADHVRQSHRFKYSVEELEAYLNDPTIHTHYQIPRPLMVRALVAVGLRQPLYLAGFLAISLYTQLLGRQQPTAAWEMATSTKNLGEANHE